MSTKSVKFPHAFTTRKMTGVGMKALHDNYRFRDRRKGFAAIS